MNDHYAPGVEHLRIPPHSIDAEQSVLGALMLTSVDTVEKVADIITEDDFYRRDHQLIFEAIAELSARTEPSDAVQRDVAAWRTHQPPSVTLAMSGSSR